MSTEKSLTNSCPAIITPERDTVSGYTIMKLLTLPVFHFYCLGASLIQFGYPIAGTFLADCAYQHGLTSDHAAVLMVLLGK